MNCPKCGVPIGFLRRISSSLCMTCSEVELQERERERRSF